MTNHNRDTYRHYICCFRDVVNYRDQNLIRSSISKEFCHRKDIGEIATRLYARRLRDWEIVCKVWMT